MQKKVLIVGQNLRLGGVQRALLNFVGYLSQKEEYDVTLFCFGDGLLREEIPANVRVLSGCRKLQLIATPLAEVLSSRSKSDKAWRIGACFLAEIFGSSCVYQALFNAMDANEQFDIAISYFSDVPNGLFNKGTAQYVREFSNANHKIAWLHTDPIRAGYTADFCRKTYMGMERIVCVSKACEEALLRLMPEAKGKTCVVYNYFPRERIQLLSSEKLFYTQRDVTVHLVSVGRIDNETKRYHLIPKIVKEIIKNGFEDFSWDVIGDGPDLESNQAKVQEEGLERYITYRGGCANPYPAIKNSDALVMMSAYEGYPMVVGEAMVLGTPVISTPYRAIAEQITDRVNGLCPQNVEQLGIVLADTMKTGTLKTLARQAEETDINGNFEKQFKKLIENVN